MVDTSLLSSQNFISEYTLSTKETSSNCPEHCLTRRHLSLNHKFINIESYQLVWLSSEFTTLGTENDNKSATFDHLSTIVDRIMIFSNVEQCQEYLQESEKIGTTTFLVCCYPLAKILVPQLLNYNKIQSIYIISENQQEYQDWRVKNAKIKQNYHTLETLLLDLSKHLEEFKKYEDRLDFTQVRTKIDDMNNDEHSIDNPWSSWIEFIEILLYIPYPANYCRRRFDLLKEYCAGNTVQIKLIDEFQSNYNPNDAIRWYSRDTCLYRLLNESLRKHNIELLFLFGYFIQGIYKQLSHEYEQFRLIHLNNPIITVYRGQMMSRNEINDLANYHFIVNNSFFSTTLQRHLATAFLNSFAESHDELQNVLFEIKLNLKLETRPFANISHLSYFQNEDELLFSVGTLFEINNIVYNEIERLWLVQMELSYDESIKDIRDFENESSSRRTLKNCVNKLTAFNIHEWSSINFKKTIFNELIELFPEENKWFSAIQLKSQSEEKRLFDEGVSNSEIVSNYEQAIKIWQDYQNDIELNCSIEVGELYKDIADYYSNEIHCSDLAEKYCDLAIEHYLVALEKELNEYEKMKIYNEISIVFQLKMKPMMIDDEEKYENSLEKERVVSLAAKYKELYIEYMLKFYSSDHIEIGRTFAYLAYLYKSIDKFDNASVSYDKALNVFLQHSYFYLGEDEVEHLINEIVYFHMEDRHDYQEALRYQLIKHDYITKMATTSKSDNRNRTKQSMADSYIQLADIYSLLDQKELALENLTMATDLYNQIDDEKADLFQKEEKLASIREKRKKLTDVPSCACDNNKRFKEGND